MGHSVNSSAASANAALQSAQARAQGLADRKTAYARAYGLEHDSAERGRIAAQQMQTMRQNQTAAESATRLQNAASGFDASSGSKLRSEMSTAQIFEEAIANAGKSYAIADQNARNQAASFRKEGDDALKMSQIMANYYSRVSKINSTAANWQLLGGTLNTIGDSMFTFNIGGASEQIRDWGAPSAKNTKYHQKSPSSTKTASES